MGFLKKLDWQLNIAVGLLLAFGLLALASSTQFLIWRQLIWVAVGAAIIFSTSFINFKRLMSYRWVIVVIYLLGISLLLLNLVIGSEAHGNKSWINIGSFKFQASEFAKIGLIVILAKFFSRSHIGIKRFGVIFTSFLYLLLPVFLILLQPDLGTALIFCGIWAGFLFVSGLPKKYVAVALPALILCGLIVWGVGLKDYQRNRIVGLLKPDVDPLGVNYNAIQSKIAIGSAGWFGKGFGQGAQVRLGFLPAAQTDFVYAAFTEEWGLVGATALILAFLWMVWRILVVGTKSHGNFDKFVCIGSALLFVFQFAINIGSTVGFLPVIGVGLPFVSYGGSSLLTSFILIGIIQNIAATTI
ncbi:MAG: rod shape-determining protein RodA [Patescibacteria group bacterium]|nr:rod shape-determining protein RodA [Patescibacteria group bacterium]MCL5262118.1 rod shape-determining protein RodA [Patescibacteria group bacterium]